MLSKKRADSPVTTIISQPQVVPPTGDFDGDDGNWSTFSINIGDDGTGQGQNFRVLISTSSPVTMVPKQADWCKTTTCAQDRGIQAFSGQQSLGFNSQKSKAWKEEGLYSIPLPNWWTGTKGGATWGTDNVGIGPSSTQSLVQVNQWVVEYDYDDWYMGSFGLAAGSIDPGGNPKSTFLPSFTSSNSTPSTSYGYTAGAKYRNNSNGVLGSLVLGGFDQSRFSELGASIAMPSTANNTLVVGVQSILYHPDPDKDSNTYSLTAKTSNASGNLGFVATIDSTLPYLWLPDEICDEFASRFRLTYDNTTELYRVNDTSHSYNQGQNATVTFKIAKSLEGTQEFATITLPYAAFYLQGNSPLFPNATNYFPIRKSPTGIFVLGRTFLQEAYIVVDYERANFTVAPAVYSDPMPAEQIVPIYKKGYIPPTASPTAIAGSPGSSKGGLAPGAVAGIVVGIVLLFLLLGLGAFFFWKRRRTAKAKSDKQEIAEIDTTYAGTEVKHHDPMSELDGDPQGKPPSGYYGAGGRDTKDFVPFPGLNEMESPPAELYSPPTESAPLSSVTPGSERNGVDYFSKPRRRGATRESSGNGTPGTPGIGAVHELPGDDGQFQVGGVHFDRVESPTPNSPVQHSRGPSDTSLATNIDEVISGQQMPTIAGSPTSPTGAGERRPSHARGASDTTVQSDTTAVSLPTPEEIENWAMGVDEPRRPLSE